jgi:hypothetical protein
LRDRQCKDGKKKRRIHLKRRESGQVAIKGGSGRPNVGDGSGVLVRAWKESLVGLNVEEQNQIMDVDADRINFTELSGDERFGVGVQNRGEGIENEPGVVNGDLQ